MKQYTIKQGNNIDTLKEYPDNHFDSIVTDPPYGIEFLSKEWDKNTGAVETWAECFRVLKPGGYILAFSAARTYHHLATNIEGVGFEIRDQLMWLYSSGFPKAQDIGKAIDKRAGKTDKNYGSSSGKKGEVYESFNHPVCNKCLKGVSYEAKCKDTECGMRYNYQTSQGELWAGWKTALKPAHEPIVMARKPFKGSCIDNVLTHGVGALNIDATRIDYECDYDAKHQADISRGQENATNGTNFFGSIKSVSDDKGQGRFPSNVLGEVEGYQKFFYCPKVSRAERHIGFETKDIPAPFGDVKGCYVDGERFAAKHQEYQGVAPNNKPTQNMGNNHPTVKPVALMKYLVTLVTPAGGKVLDPFCGSGSTGMAAVELGHDFTGCELDPDYVNIAETRIDAWYEHTQPDTTYNELFEEE